MSLYEQLCRRNTRLCWKSSSYAVSAIKFKHLPNLENLTVKTKMALSEPYAAAKV